MIDFIMKVFKFYRKWSPIVFFLIIAPLFFYYHVSKSSSCADLFKIEKNNTYSGVVLKRYIDRANHMEKTVKINSTHGEKNIFLTFDKSLLFDKIKVGDSIIKQSGSYDVLIKRSEKEFTVQIDYKCR